MIHELIYYLSYISFPFLIYLLYILIKKREYKKLSTNSFALYLFIFGTVLFIYSRFIEPNMIYINKIEIDVGFKGKLVVISDTHLGIYKGRGFLDRVVNKINEIEDVDATIIAGDLTYHADDEQLEYLFEPLKKIKSPVFVVFGNHDYLGPNPPNLKKLREAVSKNSAIFLENSVDFLKTKNIKIVGLGDKWSRNDDISVLEQFSNSDNIVVVTHNPDTTIKYSNKIADLTISGHTHGGQIRIPFIYEKFIPSEFKFNKGFYNTKNGKLFVSSGVGEIGLPMRFLVPPTIDVLILK